MQFKKEYNNLPRTEKDRIIKQYKIEVRYAAILKRTPNPERAHLYKKLYDDFYRRLPEHPLKIKAKKKVTLRIKRNGKLSFFCHF